MGWYSGFEFKEKASDGSKVALKASGILKEL